MSALDGGVGLGDIPGQPSLSTLLNQLAFLKQQVGVGGSDEELEWLMASKKAGAFAYASQKVEHAMDEYLRSLAESSQASEKKQELQAATSKMMPVLATLSQLTTTAADDPREVQEKQMLLTKLQRKEISREMQIIDAKQMQKSGVTANSGRGPLLDTQWKKMQRLGRETDLNTVAALAAGLHADLSAELLALTAITTSSEAAQSTALEAAEKWGTREKSASDYHSSMVERDRAWLQAESQANAAALATMRSLLPPNITELSAGALVLAAAAATTANTTTTTNTTSSNSKVQAEPQEDASTASLAVGGAGVVLPLELAVELKKNLLLHWCVTHTHDIANANFLTGANRPIFDAFTHLDIVETRALASVLPEKFSFDKDGSKEQWRRRFLDRAMEIVGQQQGTLIKGRWDLSKGCRSLVKPQALTDALTRRKVYFYPTIKETSAKCKDYSGKTALLATRQAALSTAEEAVKEAKSELDIIIAEGRDPTMKLQVGAERLSRAKNMAKTELSRAEAERNKALTAVQRVQGTISSYMQTEAEYLEYVQKLHGMPASASASASACVPWASRTESMARLLVPGAFALHPDIPRAERSRAVKGFDIQEGIRGREAELAAIRKKNTAGAGAGAGGIEENNPPSNRYSVGKGGGGCRSSVGGKSVQFDIQLAATTPLPLSARRDSGSSRPTTPGAYYTGDAPDTGTTVGEGEAASSTKEGKADPGRVRVNPLLLNTLNKMFSGASAGASTSNKSLRKRAGSTSEDAQATLAQACNPGATPVRAPAATATGAGAGTSGECSNSSNTSGAGAGDAAVKASHAITPRTRTEASNKTRSRLLKRLLATLSPPPPQKGQEGVQQEHGLGLGENADPNAGPALGLGDILSAAAAAAADQAQSPQARRKSETQAKVHILGKILGSAAKVQGQQGLLGQKRLPLSPMVASGSEQRPKGSVGLFGRTGTGGGGGGVSFLDAIKNRRVE